ncbi:MAG: ParA family protein [Mariprofundales bacterium]|nr:ParA family protein [Mariprofundales bacterium]
MKVIALYSLKGGVGKTTAAVNLAHLSSLSGARTLVWDLDPQGSASFYFRIDDRVKGGRKALCREEMLQAAIRGSNYELLDLLPADLSYRNMEIALDSKGRQNNLISSVINAVQCDYDFLFLDCPPGLSRLSEAVFTHADLVLVPSIPTILSMRTLKRISDFRKKRGLTESTMRAFFSLVDRRKRMHNAWVGRIDQMRPLMLSAQIPALSEVELMGEYRSPLTAFRPKSRVSAEFRKLWREMMELWYG